MKMLELLEIFTFSSIITASTSWEISGIKILLDENDNQCPKGYTNVQVQTKDANKNDDNALGHYFPRVCSLRV